MTRFRVAAVVVLLSVLASAAAPAARADDPPYYIPEETPVAVFYGIDENDGAALYDVWVPVTGNGSTDGPWRPDVPQTVQWRIWSPGPGAVYREAKEGQTCIVNGKPSPFFSPYCCITVPQDRLPLLANAIPVHEVADHDKLLLRMVRCFERDRDGYLTPAAVAAVEQVFRDEQAFAETDEGYQMMVKLVWRMYWREVPLATCNRIANMLARVHASAQE